MHNRGLVAFAVRVHPILAVVTREILEELKCFASKHWLCRSHLTPRCFRLSYKAASLSVHDSQGRSIPPILGGGLSVGQTFLSVPFSIFENPRRTTGRYARPARLALAAKHACQLVCLHEQLHSYGKNQGPPQAGSWQLRPR